MTFPLEGFSFQLTECQGQGYCPDSLSVSGLWSLVSQKHDHRTMAVIYLIGLQSGVQYSTAYFAKHNKCTQSFNASIHLLFFRLKKGLKSTNTFAQTHRFQHLCRAGFSF